MVRFVLVEDERYAADAISEYLEKYFSERSEKYEFRRYDNAVSFLTDYRSDCDVVFMDIEMPMLDGMSAAEKLRKLDPYVIIVFVTNMQQYAIKGYAVNALDFMIKPINYFGFSSLMNKIMRALVTKNEREIIIGAQGNIRRLHVSDILYIEVSRHRLTYHTVEGCFNGWGSLNDLEEKLPPDLFSRCNACYLINLRYVKCVAGDELQLSSGETLRISHLKKTSFLEDLAKYLGRRC